MEEESYVQGKIKGLPEDVEFTREKLKLLFTVVETSPVIRHKNDRLSHQFLILFKKEGQG